MPTLVLAMYRATAAAYYSNEPAGNMLIYNDCFRLAEQLRTFIDSLKTRPSDTQLPHNARPSTRLRLDTDIKALEGFGKRSYAREMEAQRTIVQDLIDGAQGFNNCTTQPFAGECENAVRITVDRIREMHSQWKDVLSKSALMQSLGSLVSTVVSKVVIDIQDMSDISEEESKRLKHFCDMLNGLKELFIQEQPLAPGASPPVREDGAAANRADMTGVWVPNWFKLQYLAEILESSLADIKYLWMESELHLEFDAEEVVDLVVALFAESDYRRRAINEIKRAAEHGS